MVNGPERWSVSPNLPLTEALNLPFLDLRMGVSMELTSKLQLWKGKPQGLALSSRMHVLLKLPSSCPLHFIVSMQYHVLRFPLSMLLRTVALTQLLNVIEFDLG